MSDIMMTKKYFLDLVGASIQGLPVPLCPDTVDGNKVYKLAVRNAVQGILYLAVKDGKIKLSQENAIKLEKTYMATLAREATQQAEIQSTRQEFADKGISFMFLKGTHLKSLYPAPEMRFMVDMDILIKEECLENAKEIMLSRGFKTEINSSKDIVLIKEPFLTVELHKMLFVEDYFMHDYFTGVWDKAEKVHNNEYKMTLNDLYVYTLAHLAEHYLDAGSCFRPMMDLVLMEKSYDLDFEYINDQFENLGIDKFALKIRELYKCMFQKGEYNDDLKLMENYIVLGPPVKNAQAASQMATSNEGKLKKIIKVLFPSFKHMSLKYDIVKKIPLLLPMFWVVRWFEYAFKKDSRTQDRKEQLLNVEQQNVDVMKEIFQKSGL